jgi:hypothetical protein
MLVHRFRIGRRHDSCRTGTLRVADGGILTNEYAMALYQLRQLDPPSSAPATK